MQINSAKGESELSGMDEANVRKVRLTPREYQIVKRIATQFYGNKEIANDLGLTPATVKQYLHGLFSKVGVKSRTDLAMWAVNAYPKEFWNSIS